MPIYMKIDGVQGDVTADDTRNAAGSSNGGVWKTTNFLTRDGSASSPSARPKIKVFICPSDPGVVQISRMSLATGANAVDGRDPSAKFKVEQLINAARSQGPNGKLFVATDVGVFADSNTSRFDPLGRLLVGTEGGIWRSEGARRGQCINNMKQLSLGMHRQTIDIIVTDAGGTTVGTYRLQNATVSRHPGGVNVMLGDGSVK